MTKVTAGLHPVPRADIKARLPRDTSPSPHPSPCPPPPPMEMEHTTLSLSLAALGLPARKLLVLDLNKCLVYRPKGGKKTTCYARPYLSPFLLYLFHPLIKSRLDVMVWSSAKHDKVQRIVDRIFGSLTPSLVACWGAEQMKRTPKPFEGKCHKPKDLALVWAEFAHSSYDLTNTILLDDSPEKAIYQALNHLPIPKYDATRRQLDQVALFNPNSNVTVDESLLAIVGILDSLLDAPSVPRWIAAGGLWEASGVPLCPEEHMAMDPNLPPPQWFEDRPTFEAWAARGKRVLTALGIDWSESGVMPSKVTTKRERIPMPDRSVARSFTV
ncbi:hypothetical protein BOTBODRAFT_182912 [Botryobasidium botryosum FD-172 SS1]|uniref:Mitochondrial import inner membrane translocase subunit TIM50 n=1 Tax=Botryobasidium botryosum (strain FD-172 SS1) TaxID=930990 RepID=A0A067N3S6_BOTB1|nr:hypothetical protein BOTBODRAFT_182912 [Botryobasidium botryosum FD-172 SS1]